MLPGIKSRLSQNANCTQAYLKQLQSNPLRTKVLTSGTLSGLQELLASWIAHDKNKHGHYFTSRVPKMALYGALVSAPLGHVLISILQRLFAGRTSLKAKILQIITSNLIVSYHCASFPQHLVKLLSLGCTNPKLCISYCHGSDRRRPHIPPSPRDRQSWFLASNARQLAHIASLSCICASFPSTGDLGAILQHCRICDWYIHQLAHQEEETCCFATKALWRWT